MIQRIGLTVKQMLERTTQILLTLTSSNTGLIGRHKFIFTGVNTGEVTVKEYKNIVVNSGKNMIARRLAGENNSCNITYGAVGTLATTPLDSDTILGTEIARKAVSSISASGGVVTVTVFFTASEGNGNLREYGLFGEGAVSIADTGVLVIHALINEDKTSSKTLTIESTIEVK